MRRRDLLAWCGWAGFAPLTVPSWAGAAGESAAVQLQLLARWTGLDGSVLLKHDPFQGARIEDGRWHPTDRPGLGVRPSDRSPK